ncbi:MAG: hypothetical protein JNG89_01165 [Planctomycetaceae bacterium]|nr:hypothetical protein [Planctomycetaceae bacterium]
MQPEYSVQQLRRVSARNMQNMASFVAGLLLAAFLVLQPNLPAADEPRGQWTDGDPQQTLAEPHLLGAATLLPTGQVIAAGGVDRKSPGFPAITTAELYDPLARRWTKTEPLNVPRWSLDAITLPSGKALFAGGASAFSPAPALDSAELYDPQTGRFSLTSNTLSVGRQSFGISLLTDGRVLLTGGNTSGNNLGGSGVTAVDIYDPETDRFQAAAALHQGRALHAQLTLRDGRVVVIGGAQNSAEIYDPQANAWTLLSGALPTTLKDNKAFEMPDGRIFLAAGQNTVDGLTTDATWVLNPDSGELLPGPGMAGFNYGPPGVQVGVSDYSAFDLFPAGHSLAGRYFLYAGGEHDPPEGLDIEYNSASIFDVANDRFINVGPMPFVHDDHTESLLRINDRGNPEVLLFGGNSTRGTSRFELVLSTLPAH